MSEGPRVQDLQHSHVPIIVRVINGVDTGGHRKWSVGLIGRISANHVCHAIMCLATYSNFRPRWRRKDVSVFAPNRSPCRSPLTIILVWWLMRMLWSTIVHTRILAALDAAIPAALVGAPARIHGEHGRDLADLGGNNADCQTLYRLFKSLMNCYIALSKDLASYLHEKISARPGEITQIYNGVDTAVYCSSPEAREPLPIVESASYVVGTVGRMRSGKDQLTLAHPFMVLLQMVPRSKRQLWLVMIEDGPLRAAINDLFKRAGLANLISFPGDRNDVAQTMRFSDLFVLPSLAEEISNTILEAMSTGLPWMATAVGGSPELVVAEHSGALVPPHDLKEKRWLFATKS